MSPSRSPRVLIVWLLWPRAPRKGIAAFGFFVVLPFAGFALLSGAPSLGLPRVGTSLWGGAMVSLLVALSGIVVALPGGVLLALGRRSELPALRMVCAGLIEFVRGVPLIAVLFMANAMLPCSCRRTGRPTGCCGRCSASLCSPRPIWRRSRARG